MTEFFQLHLVTADADPKKGVIVQCCLCPSMIEGISKEYKNPVCIQCGKAIVERRLRGVVGYDEEG